MSMTPVFDSALLANLLTSPDDFQVVTMVDSDQGNNTFTAKSGALRSPNFPSAGPSAASTSWTTFSGIAGVSRTVSGTITFTDNTARVRITDGSAPTGRILNLAGLLAAEVPGTVSFSFTSSVNQTFTVSVFTEAANSVTFALDVVASETVSLSPGQISAQGGFLRARDASGTFFLRNATQAAADVQVFTANGTWTKPSGVNVVQLYIVGGGGGGGSGRQGAASSTRFGGYGGAAGAVVSFATIPASVFAATAAVIVGSGGNGGSAAAAIDTNGANGTSGGVSSFSVGSTLVRALGGGNGSGGSTTAGTAGVGNAGDASDGCNGGNGSSTNGAVSIPGTGIYHAASGGGGGGGLDSFNLARTGGSSRLTSTTALGLGYVGATPLLGGTGTSPAPGSYQSTSNGIGSISFLATPHGGSGGGGGGSFSTPGNGAAGGYYGGGGGGGAASLNGTASGAGGNGGPGLVVVVSW